MSISFSCTMIPADEQSALSPAEVADRAAYLASLPPPQHPAPASIAELVTRLDPDPTPIADDADPVNSWLADLVARPVASTTRFAVAVLDPAELAGAAVRHYLVLTDKVQAADTAVQHAAVLAVADTARAEVETILTENATAAAGTPTVAPTRWSSPSRPPPRLASMVSTSSTIDIQQTHALGGRAGRRPEPASLVSLAVMHERVRA